MSSSQADAEEGLAICQNPKLSDLKLVRSEAFEEIEPNAAKAIARPTSKAHHNCGSDATCIEGVLMQPMRGYWEAGASYSDVQNINDLNETWIKANKTCRGASDATEVVEGGLSRDLASIKRHDICFCEGNYLLDAPNFAIATILREYWLPCVYKEPQK